MFSVEHMAKMSFMELKWGTNGIEGIVAQKVADCNATKLNFGFCYLAQDGQYIQVIIPLLQHLWCYSQAGVSSQLYICLIARYIYMRSLIANSNFDTLILNPHDSL